MNDYDTKIKICGLTTIEDALLVNKYEVEYAGFVLFYEKSKRCLTVQSAWNIMRYLKPGIKKTAVTVSPTLEQLEMIEHMAFDYLQVHGELRAEVIEHSHLPILRAFNIQDQGQVQACEDHEKIAGYVLDGHDPGSGKAFDWTAMRQFDRNGKLLFLAGGLDSSNVGHGIEIIKPDVVDVSSGVEGSSGKEEEKIKAFVGKVRGYEQ